MELESSSPESDPSGSEDDVDRPGVCAITASKQAKLTQDHRMSHVEADRGELRYHGEGSKACNHCVSIKHSDRGCWNILTCQKCGRKRRSSEKCFYASAACGKGHESGNLSLEEFYNLIRKWFVPPKHEVMFPSEAEEMLK